MRAALGDHVYGSLLSNKWIEWDEERRHITDDELKRYPPMLKCG